MNKKVLHVVSVSFSIKYFIGDQFNYFKEKGFDFHVACSDSEELHDFAEHYGFKVFPIPILRSIDPIEDIKSIFKLRNYIKKEGFDYVISHSPKGGLIGMTAAFLAGVRNRVYFRHGLVFETANGLKKELLISIEKLIGRLSKKVVNVSRSVEKVSNFYRLNRVSKNILLGEGTCNGINTEIFKRRTNLNKQNNTIIGYVGRLTKDKGIIELIEAWKILLKKYDDIQLLLVGPIDSRAPLSSDVLDYILNEHSINFVGSVSDAANYYNMMNVFILPSYREGFPTVVLEASSSGLPIITSRYTGCIDSIIENRTGIFVDIVGFDIAKGIETYLLDKDLAILHGLNGRSFVVENFSQEVIYQEIEKKILS